MKKKILVAPIFENKELESPDRTQGLEALAEFAEVRSYDNKIFTGRDAPGVVAIIANSSLFERSFYEAAKDQRIIARWGVGYDKVNVDIATELGVIITVAPVHMDAVAEYAIAQWMATLKRLYSLNNLSHKGDFSIIRTHEAQNSTLGLYGFGRIGQEMAARAKPLLGPNGRLLVYDFRPDIDDLAHKFGAEVVSSPIELFQNCDAVSLHVSGDETIVGYKDLCAMRPLASLIYPSRGNLVDDRAVHRAIEEDRLYYYVVDDPTDGPRAIHTGHPRIICTNHNAGISIESAIRLDQQTFEQVTDAVHGKKPQHILNPDVLKHPKVQAFLNQHKVIEG